MKRPQHDGPLPKCLTAIVAKVRAAFELLVPFGYEDESGFHIGTMPVQGESGQYFRVQEQDEASGALTET